MQRIEAPSDTSIMAIVAHPDDIECWCAGTLARAIDRGSSARLLLVTSGEKGTRDASVPPELVRCRREQEATRAAHQLGLTDVAFLRYPDAELEDTRALRADLVRWIRRWRPSLVFTHDPEHGSPPYLNHRDHRITGRAALDAIYPLARDSLAFPEQLDDGVTPQAVHDIWLFATEAPTASVDITATLERKIAARLEHVSQTENPDSLRRTWRERAASSGRSVGLAFAESFVVLHHA